MIFHLHPVTLIVSNFLRLVYLLMCCFSEHWVCLVAGNFWDMKRVIIFSMVDSESFKQVIMIARIRCLINFNGELFMRKVSTLERLDVCLKQKYFISAETGSCGKFSLFFLQTHKH